MFGSALLHRQQMRTASGPGTRATKRHQEAMRDESERASGVGKLESPLAWSLCPLEQRNAFCLRG